VMLKGIGKQLIFWFAWCARLVWRHQPELG